MIDISKIKIPANLVLIKLDPDFETYHSKETGNDTGLFVAPWGINQASHLSVTGVVVTVPQRLNYRGYLTNTLKKERDRSEQKQKYIALLRNESVSYDVDCEIQPGMRVYFEYTTRLNAFNEGRVIEQDGDKYIFIQYDLLIMAFRPTTDPTNIKISDVYMLNGYILIKPLEYDTTEIMPGIKGITTPEELFMPVQEDAKYVKQGFVQWANVLAAGCLVRAYIDFPDARRDGSDIGAVGQKISYNAKQQKRLEVEHHRVIFKQHTLYRIHRKDILAWYPGGKI